MNEAVGGGPVRAAREKKRQRRTIYVRHSTEIETWAEEDPGRAGRTVYKARSVDFPDVEAEGATPEGAMVGCERALAGRVSELARKGDQGDG